MKKIIIVVCFIFPILVFGQTQSNFSNERLELFNSAGGKIVLKFTMCELNGRVFNRLYNVYAYSSNGTTVLGCWGYVDKKIRVLWENGKQSIFEPENFEFFKE